ncbi:MAG TPA: hypothetical protein VIM55_08270 [Mucilaginibacter sp.]
MKKLLFAAALLCGAFQLKAQQQTEVKAVDPVTASINKEIQDQTNSWQKLTSKLNAAPLLATNEIKPVNKVIIGTPDVDNMPVAVLEGNSKMPIAKPNSYDHMPILKTGSNVNQDNLIIKKVSPAFKLPAVLSPAPKK